MAGTITGSKLEDFKRYPMLDLANEVGGLLILVRCMRYPLMDIDSPLDRIFKASPLS
jgi:hypothetical protein